MGFIKKVLSPTMPQSIHTVSTPPPVVADTVQTDSAAAYEQRAATKKGLLSTILSKSQDARSHQEYGGNQTLG